MYTPFLEYSRYERSGTDNYRNGYTTKTVKTRTGEVELKVPRDRKGGFESRIVRKRQTMLEKLEHQIVTLYAKGMTTRDIEEILTECMG